MESVHKSFALRTSLITNVAANEAKFGIISGVFYNQVPVCDDDNPDCHKYIINDNPIQTLCLSSFGR